MPQFFFLSEFSFTFTIHRTAGEGGGFFLTPLYHFNPLQIQLDISRANTEESLPLHIGSSRAQTGNLPFFWKGIQQSGLINEMMIQKKLTGLEKMKVLIISHVKYLLGINLIAIS